MPRNRTVTLADKEYSIVQRNMRDNKDWREKLSAPVNKIIGLMRNYKNIEIGTAADIASIVSLFSDILLGSMDILLDAMFAYSPELESDRERIESESYDDEAIAALGEIIRLAYPLDRFLSVWTGQVETQTSTNSALQNGAAGTKRLVGQKNT